GEASAYTPIVTPVVTSIDSPLSPENQKQSVSQSAVPAAPSLSVEKSSTPPSSKFEDPYTFENYVAKNYPLIEDGNDWYHPVITGFYNLAGSKTRMEANKWRDVFACWELLSTKRVDEVSFVMETILSGRIAYYKGRKRPFDFHYFAAHYDHARDLVEEQLLADDAKRGCQAKGNRDEINAPWNWQTSGWVGHSAVHGQIRPWSYCDHRFEGKAAFLNDTDWCYVCGAPIEFIGSQEAERKAKEAFEQDQQERRERVAKYEFRHPTKQEEKEFFAIRGEDGWVPGVVSKRVKDGTWRDKHVSAAILYVLHHVAGPISYSAFEVLIDDIKDLEDNTPATRKP
ncbi:MAG: hypothetical protein JWN45_3071, partial [Acidobacteriaceae bacterium]|nr:hypothetical protein [Acidobacteriaceae bacterium]